MTVNGLWLAVYNRSCSKTQSSFKVYELLVETRQLSADGSETTYMPLCGELCSCNCFANLTLDRDYSVVTETLGHLIFAE